MINSEGLSKQLVLLTKFLGKKYLSFTKRSDFILGDKLLSQGQCMMGARRLFVSTDGIYYPCERIRDRLPIGDVDNGIDLKAICQYMADYNEIFKDKCRNCYAVRLCTSKCYRDFLDGDYFSDLYLDKICSINIQQIDSMFSHYLRMIENNPNAFKKYEMIEIE